MESTGRGNSIGITIPKASSSQICEDHVAGALTWNPRGGGTQFGMRCHKGTPFDHVSVMISTNKKPGFLALAQWEALICNEIPKASSSHICENHGAGELNWNYYP